MSMAWIGARKTFDVPCTVEIEHTPESLHAHVEIDGDFTIEPGATVNASSRGRKKSRSWIDRTVAWWRRNSSSNWASAVTSARSR